jgi:NTP pyrophosphatase (non-canonical NTP hydrolase)
MIFAQDMESSLAKHDEERGPTGWRNKSLAFLFYRLHQEVLELHEVILSGDSRNIRSEAVDVANFAMMISDIQPIVAHVCDNQVAESDD